MPVERATNIQEKKGRTAFSASATRSIVGIIQSLILYARV